MVETLAELRAISRGADPILVECVGVSAIQSLMDEGANIQALKLKMSAPMKDAKYNMKRAKKLAREGKNAEASQAYDAAIKNLKELQKAAEEIDDDHIVMVAVDAFIKSFVPIFAGSLVAMLAPGSIVGSLGYISGTVGGYICGMSKVLDFSAAVDKKLTSANKAGVDGKQDPSHWWKVGETRGAVMTKLDRMITACETAKKKLK